MKTNKYSKLDTNTIDYCQSVGVNPLKFSMWIQYIKNQNQKIYFDKLKKL
jgi:hypothetical protein